MRTHFVVPKAVVIGADGFIGRRLTLALSAASVEVETYTREREFSRGTQLARPLRHADVVYYLATRIQPALAEQHPEWAAADHRQFAGLLRELALLESPPTVVLTSSGGTVYDPSVPPPYAEESPTRATSLYAAAKIALEDELTRRAGTIHGVILRLSNVYGPGQPTGKHQGVLAYWLQAAARGIALPVMGDPADTRDYVYIDDVAACMGQLHDATRRRSCMPDREPLILNIGSGTGTSLAELVNIVRTVVGRELEVEWLLARRIDRRHVWLDCGRAKRVVGWCPQTRLIDGVSAMWRELTGGPATCLDAQAGRARTVASTPAAEVFD